MKVVLITGASSGFGAAVAKEAARRNDRLVLVARRKDRLESVAEECRAHGASEVLLLPLDLEAAETPSAVVNETIKAFGRIDVLINNAGFGLPTLFADSDPQALRQQIEVNFVAPLMLARHSLPHLIKTKGSIINIGSAITCVANPALGAYGATKSGLAYWSSALRREVAHLGVSVSLVEPGPIKTEFFSALQNRNRLSMKHHPLLDAPFPWMSGDLDVAAKRIVSLIDSRRRRLSVPKRFVLPWRLLGGVLQVLPGFGDALVSFVVRYHDAKIDRRPPHASNVD